MFSLRGQIVNVFGFAGHGSLSQPFNAAMVAGEPLQTVCKQTVWLSSNKTLFTKMYDRLDLTL